MKRKSLSIMAKRKIRRRRILHTSDVHLETLDDKSCQSLEALVNVAIEAKVDLVVAAGDFFDSNRVDDNLVSFVVEQLKRLSVPTFILPGNHDCLVPNSVYDRAELWKDATNVHVFRALAGETLTFPDLGISIWGKPVASDDDYLHPLVGIPLPQRNGYWHIAVIHGCFTDPQSPPWARFHTTHEDIVASRRDYVALGDSHSFMCICNAPVKAYYCGSPSYSSETVAIVDFIDGMEPQVTCYPL